jgi:hypothetical protein
MCLKMQARQFFHCSSEVQQTDLHHTGHDTPTELLLATSPKHSKGTKQNLEKVPILCFFYPSCTYSSKKTSCKALCKDVVQRYKGDAESLRMPLSPVICEYNQSTNSFLLKP